jgi:hypothetical protein
MYCLFCVVLCIVCVYMCTVQLPSGGYPIAVNKYIIIIQGDTRWGSWLRHCATSRKVADSIPDVLNGTFYLHNPYGPTMALGLTQPPIEISTRNISLGGKCGRCVGLRTLPPSCADCLEIWEPQPPQNLWACPGL